MARASVHPIAEAPSGYQLGIVREVLLALLATGPAHASELRARLTLAIGPLAQTLNEGQVYVTLGRLENAGLVSAARGSSSSAGNPTAAGTGRKRYELTAAGHEAVTRWLADVSWPKPAPAEFHLKLVAAAAAGLADPISLVDLQRRELLVGLREAQRAALAEPDGSIGTLLLEGVVLRLQADLRWLEACARHWSAATASE